MVTQSKFSDHFLYIICPLHNIIFLDIGTGFKIPCLPKDGHRVCNFTNFIAVLYYSRISRQEKLMISLKIGHLWVPHPLNESLIHMIHVS